MIAARYSTGGVARTQAGDERHHQRPALEPAADRQSGGCGYCIRLQERAGGIATGRRRGWTLARPEARREQDGEGPRQRTDRDLQVRRGRTAGGRNRHSHYGNRDTAQKQQYNQRNRDAGRHAAEPENEQIERGTWPRNQERRDPGCGPGRSPLQRQHDNCAPHRRYPWLNAAVRTGKPLQRRPSRVVAHISTVSLMSRRLSVPLASIHVGCHHSPAMTTAACHGTLRIAVGPNAYGCQRCRHGTVRTQQCETPDPTPRRCEKWQRSWPTLRRRSAICSRSARCSRNCPTAATRFICARLSTGVEMGRRLGFATDAIDPRIEAIVHDDWKASNPRAALKKAVDVFCRRAAYEVR